MHNHPDNLKPAADCKHLKFSLADVDTEDISPLFAPSFDFIEGARKGGHGEPPGHSCHQHPCGGNSAFAGRV